MFLYSPFHFCSYIIFKEGWSRIIIKKRIFTKCRGAPPESVKERQQHLVKTEIKKNYLFLNKENEVKETEIRTSEMYS